MHWLWQAWLWQAWLWQAWLWQAWLIAAGLGHLGHRNDVLLRGCIAIAAAVAISSVGPERARAESETQRAAMLPPGHAEPGTPPPPEAAQRVAADAVFQALEQAGVTIISRAGVEAQLRTSPLIECRRLPCAAEVTRTLGVDFSVLVTVWAPRGRPSSVVVTLIGAEESAAGDAPVRGTGGVERAALQALETARQRWRATQMGFLIVRTSPAGARVSVDGVDVGATPARHLLPGGMHSVAVRLAGYRTERRTINVRPRSEQNITLALVNRGAGDGAGAPGAASAAGDKGATPRKSAGDVAHWSNWAVGAGLVSAALGLAVVPVLTLAELDACQARTADLCTRKVSFGALSATLLALSAASLAAGIVFLAVQPFRVSVSVGVGHLGLRGRF